ncbi:STAS/SEC14 domain-containing protein [Shewanella sp. HL-SH8]|uniref:STAS/SEC14 domain-containing protein n=1 Tax=Shewanella sp. HL-SH8 TaxID=3436242 RepID=UPI003EB966A3
MQRHGITIGIERHQQHFFIIMKVVGKLTHEDYQIITPILDDALAQVAKLKMNMFVDISQLEGWELQAAWDDLKLGVKHRTSFNKVAIFGDQNWQGLAAKVGGWFINGEMMPFNDKHQAFEWLQN